MSNLYYKKNGALELVDEFEKEVVEESEKFGDQLSAFHRQSLLDFIEWLYMEKELEIVCRFH